MSHVWPQFNRMRLERTVRMDSFMRDQELWWRVTVFHGRAAADGENKIPPNSARDVAATRSEGISSGAEDAPPIVVEARDITDAARLALRHATASGLWMPDLGLPGPASDGRP